MKRVSTAEATLQVAQPGLGEERVAQQLPGACSSPHFAAALDAKSFLQFMRGTAEAQSQIWAIDSSDFSGGSCVFSVAPLTVTQIPTP